MIPPRHTSLSTSFAFSTLTLQRPVSPLRGELCVCTAQVHAYVHAPGGRTAYLSELAAGAEVVVADVAGRQRSATVGRVKIETRPLVCCPLICCPCWGPEGYSVGVRAMVGGQVQGWNASRGGSEHWCLSKA